MSPDEINQQQRGSDARARKAQAAGVQAFARLVQLVERSDPGQAGRVAYFLAATYNGDAYSFDLF